MGSEVLEGLELFGKVVLRDEVGEMAFELVVSVVVEAPDGGLVDGAVHAFDLPVNRHDDLGALMSC